MISNGTEGTLVPTSKWLPVDVPVDSAADLFQHQSADMHANYSVYLSSVVCQLVADRTQYTELGKQNGCNSCAFRARWLRLWDDLQAWKRACPQEMAPVQVIESQPFPQILFVHWAAISSNQLYHTACILLLGMKPVDVHLENGSVASSIWHAKRICGISFTNPHRGCLNNAIQPLWIAGRLLSHRSEHELLVNLIRSIETMTGWATSWRIADLETAWGYKVH